MVYGRIPVPKPERSAGQGDFSTPAVWLGEYSLTAIQIGLDDIISAIPVFGDIAGVVLSLYLLFIAYIFGVPNFILGRMVWLHRILLKASL